MASSQSIFECIGTIRHRGGQLRLANMDRMSCGHFINAFFHYTGQRSALKDESTPVPSCETVAEVSELVTGKKPYWSACTGYPSPDPETHMRRCMQSFAPAYIGVRGFETQINTCESFRKYYEIALKFANNSLNQRLPENYKPPSCGTVNGVIASLTGGGVQWPGCTNYDPTRVREHLTDCVASEPREYLHLRDCVSVRHMYEERLRATHGGLPSSYSVLSCTDAQAVLDKVIAYKEEQEAKRIAQAEAAEQARLEAAERQQQKIEEARAKIRAEQQARRKSSVTCDPGPNRYPDHEYGELLTSLETGCVPTLTSKAQLFAAALGEGLTSQCNLPRDTNDRMAIAKFVSASIPVAIGGRNYSASDLGDMISDQGSSQAAYAAGTMAFRSFKSCEDPHAIATANGLAKYINETASQSVWVDGCEIEYATIYSRSQCQCMADAIRGIDPNVHSREFSRGSIKALIEGNPLAALQMATLCGVGDY